MVCGMKRYTEEQRREVVRDFEASGMGAMAYCRERGVSMGSLAAWRKRHGGTTSTTSGQWLSVQPDDSSLRQMGAQGGYAIRLPGACLDVPFGFAPAEVATLLGLLLRAPQERNHFPC